MKKRQDIQRLYSIPVLVSVLLFWLVLVFFDSAWFVARYFNGKPITLLLVSAVFLFLYFKAGKRLRLLMLLIVPLSYLGEFLFSELWQWYIYREGKVPIYIPIGHAVVFATGWMLAQQALILRFFHRYRAFIVGMYILLYLFVGFVLKDTLSLLLGIFFFTALWYKRFSIFYLVMGFVVFYLELIGTGAKCWAWRSPIGIFTTVNPPLGAMFIYIGGDILLGRLLRKMLTYRIHKRRK